MDSRYNAVKTVPQSALKVIDFGKLKGKYDISPQWRWEVLTEVYGMCGVGWKFEIVSTQQATKMFGMCVIDNITRDQMSMLYDWVKGYEVDNK